jgi:general secretion pathway protein B
MSFILDALKKSENERQRHIGPSLADVHVRRRERERPWWVFAVAGLLVINLGVLAVVLMREAPEAQPTAAAPAVNAAPPLQQPAARSTPRTTTTQSTTRYEAAPEFEPSVRSLAQEAGAPDPEGGLAQVPELANDRGTASADPSLVRRIEPGASSAGAADESSPQRSEEVLPTLDNLTASGTALPELHLDIHVHSANPAERFVFVNMRKYVEGQTLNEGPAVERITSDGVVLNHRGLRFLLPRQ